MPDFPRCHDLSVVLHQSISRRAQVSRKSHADIPVPAPHPPSFLCLSQESSAPSPGRKRPLLCKRRFPRGADAPQLDPCDEHRDEGERVEPSEMDLTLRFSCPAIRDAGRRDYCSLPCTEQHATGEKLERDSLGRSTSTSHSCLSQKSSTGEARRDLSRDANGPLANVISPSFRAHSISGKLRRERQRHGLANVRQGEGFGDDVDDLRHEVVGPLALFGIAGHQQDLHVGPMG